MELSIQFLTVNMKKERLEKLYETLALLQALLLAVSITYYTADEDGDHLFGIISCVANCAFWMGTICSAIFAVVVATLDTDEQLEQLVLLYGLALLRAPMVFFVWGCVLVFLQFIFYFKLKVDAGFNCSACLGTCFVVAPLFFHCMHKMGWATKVIHTEAQAEADITRYSTPADLRQMLSSYVRNKEGGNNVLALDRDEFLSLVRASKAIKSTSVQRDFAARIFDAHVEAQLTTTLDLFVFGPNEMNGNESVEFMPDAPNELGKKMAVCEEVKEEEAEEDTWKNAVCIGKL